MSAAIWLMVLGLGAASEGPAVSVEASVDRGRVTVGDVITYRLVVEHPDGGKIDTASALGDLGGLTVIDSGDEPAISQTGRTRRQRWFKLRAEKVGSFIIPELSLAYLPPQSTPGATADATPVNVKSERVFVEVSSVLPADGSAQDIRDIKPLARFWLGIPWALIAAAALALGLVAAAFWWLLRKRPLTPKLTAVEPPHALALAALAALGRVDEDDFQAVRRWHFRISEIIRLYVEQRFGLNATDLTTEEILSKAQHRHDMNAKAREVLRDFLRSTDKVKFAEYRPAQDEIIAVLDWARMFVRDTEPLGAAAVNPG